MSLSESLRRRVVNALKVAPDEEIRRPLWEVPPRLRPLVLHERARRWGVPTDDDFDPEYH